MVGQLLTDILEPFPQFAQAFPQILEVDCVTALSMSYAELWQVLSPR
jgi:hypothetical protein